MTQNIFAIWEYTYRFVRERYLITALVRYLARTRVLSHVRKERDGSVESVIQWERQFFIQEVKLYELETDLSFFDLLSETRTASYLVSILLRWL
jgi:hypothetical protein